jgi:hypothetical protein
LGCIADDLDGFVDREAFQVQLLDPVCLAGCFCRTAEQVLVDCVDDFFVDLPP